MRGVDCCSCARRITAKKCRCTVEGKARSFKSDDGGGKGSGGDVMQNLAVLKWSSFVEAWRVGERS